MSLFARSGRSALAALLLPLFAQNSFALPTVFETVRMEESWSAASSLIDAHGPDNVLVVFDIDQTLLENTAPFGSAAWLAWQDELYAKNDPSVVAPTKRELITVQWPMVQRCTRSRPVEADSPRLVSSLKDRGVPMFTMTARSEAMRQDTIFELQANGFPFHAGNTIFTDGADKGEVLLRLFGEAPPKAVVFVDDGKYNIDNLYRALQKAPQVEALLFHYRTIEPEKAQWLGYIKTPEGTADMRGQWEEVRSNPQCAADFEDPTTY